jgi:hypothetical protein
MRPNIEAVLTGRYKQQRFNPAAGQTQMSFQEWMDRHPSLQGYDRQVQNARYNLATGAVDDGDPNAGADGYNAGKVGPAGTRGPVDPGLPAMWRGGVSDNRPSVPNTAGAANANAKRMLVAMGGPDAPTAPQGPSPYRQFLEKSWGKNAKSTAAAASAFRRAQPKKAPKPKSTTNNTQSAH